MTLLQYPIAVLSVQDDRKGISKDGKVPWNFIADRKWMNYVIKGCALAMRRKTFLELFEMERKPPFFVNPSTTIYVICRKEETLPEGWKGENLSRFWKMSEEEVIEEANEKKLDLCFFGGATQYDKVIREKMVKTIFVTQIHKNYDCDVFLDLDEALQSAYYHKAYPFPEETWEIITPKTNTKLSFEVWRREDIPQMKNLTGVLQNLYKIGCKQTNRWVLQYLEEIEHMIQSYDEVKTGLRNESISIEEERTGHGMIQRSKVDMQFDLSTGFFPMLPCKDIPWSVFVKEFYHLFIKGTTDSKEMEKDGVNLWVKNTETKRTVVTIDGKEVTQDIGDMGPMYGEVLRKMQNYNGTKGGYSGEEIDQLQMIVEAIKSGDVSKKRRLVATTYDVRQAKMGRLFPCHGVFIQFNVRSDSHGEPEKLDLMMTQRSCDAGLGCLYNIAQYALLQLLMCNVTGLKPGVLYTTFNNFHIYKNHISPLRYLLEQCEPSEMPKLNFKKKLETIDDFTPECCELLGYEAKIFLPLDMNP